MYNTVSQDGPFFHRQQPTVVIIIASSGKRLSEASDLPTTTRHFTIMYHLCMYLEVEVYDCV